MFLHSWLYILAFFGEKLQNGTIGIPIAAIKYLKFLGG